MTASWLAQMNWEVYVVDDIEHGEWTTETIESQDTRPHEIPKGSRISPEGLSALRQGSATVILDFSRSRDYRKGHIPGSTFALRSGLRQALSSTGRALRYVVTSWEPAAAQLAWYELHQATGKEVVLLEGGNQAWAGAGYTISGQEPLFASEPVDYYKRPYEGTEASSEGMQAYLDWEFGLVDQLARDGSHGFNVLVQTPANAKS